MEKLFKYNDSQVRTLLIDDQIWFAGIDIARILDYSKPSDAVMKLDDDERKLTPVSVESGQTRKTWIINESGMYSLVLTSTKPEAKAFKKWITSEVLPAIRKAGFYNANPQMGKMLEIQEFTKLMDEKRKRLDALKQQVKELDTEIKSDEITRDRMIIENPAQMKLPFDDANLIQN
jgi:prophage antirepressor-like protein